jgi:5-methylcytosine-specific restriction endonuclease McrA
MRAKAAARLRGMPSLTRDSDPKLVAQKHVYRVYRNTASKHGRRWEISFTEFLALTARDCTYCGVPPAQVATPYVTRRGEVRNSANPTWASAVVFTYNGIDRVDSSVGYVLSNCVPCCRVCNVAKSDMSSDAFEGWIDRIARNRGYSK